MKIKIAFGFLLWLAGFRPMQAQPTPISALEALGQQAFAAQDSPHAAALWQQIAQQTAQASQAADYYWRAEAHLHLGKPETALEDLLEACARNTPHPRAYQLLADHALQSTSPALWRTAAQHLDRQMFKIHSQSGLCPLAIELYERAAMHPEAMALLKKWGDSPTYFTNQGWCEQQEIRKLRAHCLAKHGFWAKAFADLDTYVYSHTQGYDCPCLLPKVALPSPWLNRIDLDAEWDRIVCAKHLDEETLQAALWRFTQLNTHFFAARFDMLQAWKRERHATPAIWAASAKMRLIRLEIARQRDQIPDSNDADALLEEVNYCFRKGFRPTVLRLYKAYAYLVKNDQKQALEYIENYITDYPNHSEGYAMRVLYHEYLGLPVAESDRAKQQKHQYEYCWQRLEWQFK